MQPSQINKELQILFIASAYLKIYLESPKASHIYDDAYKLLLLLNKIANPYLKKSKKILTKAQSLLEKIKPEPTKPKRFKKPIIPNADNDIEVHGLLFAVSLILEHKELSSCELILPYFLAEKIVKDFNDKKEVHHNNARILATKFVL